MNSLCTRSRRLAGGALMALGLAAAGCRPARPVGAPLPRCAPVELGPFRHQDTVVVAADPEIAGDPSPNPGRRFLEGWQSPSLLRFDCGGRPIPDLALRWTHDRPGLQWTFELDPTGPDAETVKSRGAGAFGSWADAARITARGHLLQFILNAPADTLLAGWSAPLLGIDRVGVGRPTLRTLAALPADPRDLLDPAAPVAVDLVFTRDRRAIDYAISQSRWLVVALPYDRSYTLIAPALPDSAPTVADSSLLAAVGPDARLPAPPFWWQRAGCPVPSYPRVAGQATEFLYLGSDPVARDVAARLVALATRTTPPRWLAATLGATGRVPRAIGADPAALHRAIDSASALVIVADPTEGCSPAPWSWGARLRIPLLETRPHLIVRRGLGPVWFDGNGIVRLDSERP